MSNTYRWSTWLAPVLRSAGIEVVEHAGWKTRGLGDHLPWAPYGVVWHHDASPRGDSPGVIKFILSDIENHGAQVWIDRKGVWHLLAAGRVGHTGKVKKGMPWNPDVIGIETDHTTGEAWPAALLDSLRLGTAAIYKHQGWSVTHLYFHKQISATGKVDPDGLDLVEEQRKVAALMNRLSALGESGRDDVRKPIVELKRVRRLARRARWSRGYGAKGRAQVELVEAALTDQGCTNYKKWQEKMGFTGKDADGIPGEASLKALGDKAGFVVV